MNGRWLGTVVLGVVILAAGPVAAQDTGGGAGRAGSFGNAGVNDQTGTARSSDPNPGSGGITRDGAGVLSDKPKTHGASGPGTTGRETSPGTTNDE